MYACMLPPQFRLLVLPRFSADVLESRSCSGSLPTRPTRTYSPATPVHVFPIPFYLPQSLSWAPDREDSLPKKELTPFGYSLRPRGCMNPLPTLNLTANGSQDFAGFRLQGKTSMALNPKVNPSYASHFSIPNQACAPSKQISNTKVNAWVTLLNIDLPMDQ